MSMTSRILLGVISLGLWAACEPPAEAPAEAPAQELTLQSEDEKTIYAIGLALAGNLAALGLSEQELEILQLGLSDGVQDAEPKVKLTEYQPKIRDLQKRRVAELTSGEKQAAAAFLDEEAAKPGAVRTDSGLVYIEKEPGEGESPAATDTVRVHYHGTLRDGKVFDSSVDRGAPFVTKLSGVIPCWTEGIQRMKPGGKARLVCPSDIAYRDRGAPPHIKPGAALAFDVELIDVVK